MIYIDNFMNWCALRKNTNARARTKTSEQETPAQINIYLHRKKLLRPVVAFFFLFLFILHVLICRSTVVRARLLHPPNNSLSNRNGRQ